MVLNQDLQDFEDFLVLGVGWSFESGFTGFRGFFSFGRCLGGCVPQHKINDNIRLFFSPLR